MVLARGWCSRAATTSFFYAQRTALYDFTLEALFSSIRLLGIYHVDKSKATRFPCVRIRHDRTAFNITILLEEAFNVGLGYTGIDACDKEVRACVHSPIILRFVLTRVSPTPVIPIKSATIL